MEVLRSYVVRVYRQEIDGLAGVVEAVQTGKVTPFHDANELCAALLLDSSAWRSKLFDDKENSK